MQTPRSMQRNNSSSMLNPFSSAGCFGKLGRSASTGGIAEDRDYYTVLNTSKSIDTNGQLTDGEDPSKPKLPPLAEELQVKPLYKSTSTNGRQMATKSGFLKKQGGKIKTWNERWFVLKGDQLHYYKDMDGKFIASIFLPGNRVATHAVRPNDTNKYVFEIFRGSDGQKMANNHESYLLSANTQTDMEDWVKVIRRVILSPFGGGIFGQRLDETLRYDRRLDHSSGCGTTSTGGKSAKSGESERRQAPIIVENCVEFIRNHGGLKEEGLFRLPGHANEVKDLQDAYDMGERPVFPPTTDVHTVASLLKGYLRELPEPIIPYERYGPLIASAKSSMADGGDASDTKKQDEMRVIKEQLNLLPQANFDLLRYMCRFLDEVQRHHNVNKMDISNLAMVFGPNIMRSKRDDALTMMSDAGLVQHVMFQFIDNHKHFFPDDEKSTPVSSLHSLPDVAMDAAGAVSSPDAGIGTLTSTASPLGTLSQPRHNTDDSGTGSMGPTPESTSKRTPPVPVLPPPLRNKPNKPLRRKTSGQGLTPSKNGLNPGEQGDIQRKSLYDNVTASSNASSDVAPPHHAYFQANNDWRSSNESGRDAPSSRTTSVATSTNAPESYYVNNHSTPSSLTNATPRSSTNAVAGSVGAPESCHSSPNDYPPSSRSVPPSNRRRPSRKHRRANGCATDEESNTESVPPDDRAFSTLSSKRSSYQNELDSSLQHDKKVISSTKGIRPDLSAAINRLSMDSVSDEASSASSAPAVPPIPSRPHRKNKKAGSGQNTGSARNSRSETELTYPSACNDANPLASNRSSHLPSSTANSVFGSALTYKELEEQVKVLQEELRKQRIEHEKRSRMLEEHYVIKMKNSTSLYSPFSQTASLPGYPNPQSPNSVSGSEPLSARTGVLDDSATDSGELGNPLSPLSSRLSLDSQSEIRYKEEVKRHAMTKIRLRNAERGLQQAEERNKQLQKEMEEFFHTFGSMMNVESPTAF